MLAGSLPVWCVLLAVCETTQAKMRILRVPLFVGAGGAVCLLGLASWFAGGGVVTGALTWALVISALGVVVVRRRSVAIGADRAAVGVAGRARDQRRQRPLDRAAGRRRGAARQGRAAAGRAWRSWCCARASRSGSPPSATRSSG